ncbi:hypothetical protein BKA69DRAFT_683269 [Paraphysoderma sedebokerense]|nr:hypothetical protein BKA69DRAFT_683269 [Paraphysoderma sedebokerense]
MLLLAIIVELTRLCIQMLAEESNDLWNNCVSHYTKASYQSRPKMIAIHNLRVPAVASVLALFLFFLESGLVNTTTYRRPYEQTTLRSNKYEDFTPDGEKSILILKIILNISEIPRGIKGFYSTPMVEINNDNIKEFLNANRAAFFKLSDGSSPYCELPVDNYQIIADSKGGLISLETMKNDYYFTAFVQGSVTSSGEAVKVSHYSQG